MTNSLQNLPPELQARLAAVMAGKQQADPGLQAAAHAAAQMQSTDQPAAQVQPPLQMQQGAPAVPVQAPQTAPKPTLVDILTLLRQEIGALRNEVSEVKQHVIASSQVNEAVGHAVGRMYQMFQPTEQAAAAPTYSQNFQSQAVDEDSDY